MLEAIRGMFDTIDGCAWEKLPDFFSRDCIYERPGYQPIEGIDALDHFYRHERRIASGRHVIEDTFQRPNGVMVAGRFSGVLRDGDEVSLGFADCYGFWNGLIRTRKTYFFTPLV